MAAGAAEVQLWAQHVALYDMLQSDTFAVILYEMMMKSLH